MSESIADVRRRCRAYDRDLAKTRNWKISRGFRDRELAIFGWPERTSLYPPLVDHATWFRDAESNRPAGILSHTYLSKQEVKEETRACGLRCEILSSSCYYAGHTIAVILTVTENFLVLSPEDLIRRREVPEYIKQRYGVELAESYFAKRATGDRGPKFVKLANVAYYRLKWVDEWFQQELRAAPCGGEDVPAPPQHNR